MKIINSVREMQEFSESFRVKGKTIALVPTMGFFHKGHLVLMEEGKKKADLLVISIFVNPTQFGVGEDFEKYPKDWDKDKEMAERVGVDVIFAPSVSDMYPKGYQTYVNVEEVTRNLCGLSRPTHFRGVTTVVAKLFNIIKPHLAIFGEKDFQQLVTIKQMVEDLNFHMEIKGIPTVRESDGLAMSSRNTYLNSEERQAALSLNRSIRRARDLYEAGEREVDKLLQEVRGVIDDEDLTEIDYIKICDSKTLEEIKRIERRAVLAMAVMIGGTRLIDNFVFEWVE